MKKVKVRNLDDDILKDLSKLAKKKGFKSREKFIIYKLKCDKEKISYAKKLENDYIVLIKRIARVLEYNTLAIKTFEKEKIDISRFY